MPGRGFHIRIACGTGQLQRVPAGMSDTGEIWQGLWVRDFGSGTVDQSWRPAADISGAGPAGNEQPEAERLIDNAETIGAAGDGACLSHCRVRPADAACRQDIRSPRQRGAEMVPRSGHRKTEHPHHLRPDAARHGLYGTGRELCRVGLE